MTAPASYQYNSGDERLDWRRNPALLGDMTYRRVCVRLFQYITEELDRTPRQARWIIEQSEQVIRDGIANDLTPRQLLQAVRDFIQGKEPQQVVSRLTIGWAVQAPTP